MPDLLHISDLHFGPAFLPDRAEAVLALAERLELAAVVVTGDLTQRAKVPQFTAAREYLGRFGAPVVVIPGNHDVPFYRVAERFLASHRNYRAHIADQLNTVTRVPGCTIVALDSTRRFTFTGGTLRPWQLEMAARVFAGVPDGDLRVVATHHNLSRPPDAAKGAPMLGAPRALAAFARAGAELVLAGHAHRAWIGRAADAPLPGMGVLPLVYCGTTTSRRGRGRERGRNSMNLIRARDGEIAVTHYLWDETEGGFRPFSEHRFGRPAGAWLDGTGR